MTKNQHDQENKKEATTSIVVLIEWGGKKPSSTWYNRLHSYGLYSRQPNTEGDKEFSLLEWRANQHGDRKRESARGVILQEGVLVVSSMTLAEDIACWAKNENKAALVQIGHMTLSSFTMSERDYEVFDKLQRAVSKRGPKSAGETGSYAVTCFDEVKTYAVDLGAMPVMCPMCGGSNVQSRMGQVSVFQMYKDTGDAKAYWLRTRFSGGSFEVPDMKQNEGDGTFYPVPKQIVGNVETPSILLDDAVLDAIAPDDASQFHLLDVAYCVSKMPATRRLEGRLLVIDAYARSGGENFMTFNAPKNGVDLLDLCVLESKYTKYL